jgi:hypothetical protein
LTAFLVLTWLLADALLAHDKRPAKEPRRAPTATVEPARARHCYARSRIHPGVVTRGRGCTQTRAAPRSSPTMMTWSGCPCTVAEPISGMCSRCIA